jgi:hypothetical protein
MIQEGDYWNHWENELKRLKPVSLEENFSFNDTMYQQARQMGLLPRKNPLDGLEAVILYAKALHVPSPSQPDR